MARPFKNNAEYFSHDADMRNDVKVKALRRKFGHTGYAVWNYILETLTDADDFEIEFWTPVNRELYAAEFDIPTEELEPIIAFCEHIGLLQRRDDFIFSEAHKRRLQAVSDMRVTRAEAGRLGGIKSGEARRLKSEANMKQNEPMLQANADSAKQNEPKESKEKESKEKENDIAEKNPIPYDKIVELWNRVCVSFPKVVKLTDGRRNKMKVRLAEFSPKPEEYLSVCEALFHRVQASSFLCGDNHNHWQATFDWLFENGSNWVKVLEGNYDNKGTYRTPVGTGQGNDVTLGIGEYIDPTGRRTYGTGAATIPATAPARPSERHYWNNSTQQWTL